MSDCMSKTVYNLIPNERMFSVDALLTAHYFTYNPIKDPYEEQYPFTQIILAIEGEGSYHVGGVSYRFAAGDMIFRPANQSSCVCWSSQTVHFALISFHCASDEMKVFRGAPIRLIREESESLFDLIKLCHRICEPTPETDELRGMRIRENTPRAALAYIYASLERFLAMVYCRLHYPDVLPDPLQKANSYVGKSELVIQTERFLQAHLSDSLSMIDVCAQFGVSQTALSKKFHAETGCGVMEYFNRLKIEEAKELIYQSSMNFTQIAEALGFSSVGYFCKRFKASVGMTPTEYSRCAPKRHVTIVK